MYFFRNGKIFAVNYTRIETTITIYHFIKVQILGISFRRNTCIIELDTYHDGTQTQFSLPNTSSTHLSWIISFLREFRRPYIITSSHSHKVYSVSVIHFHSPNNLELGNFQFLVKFCFVALYKDLLGRQHVAIVLFVVVRNRLGFAVLHAVGEHFHVKLFLNRSLFMYPYIIFPLNFNCHYISITSSQVINLIQSIWAKCF